MIFVLQTRAKKRLREQKVSQEVGFAFLRSLKFTIYWRIQIFQHVMLTLFKTFQHLIFENKAIRHMWRVAKGLDNAGIEHR